MVMFKRVFVVSLLAALVGCAGGPIDLPGVAGGEGGERLPGKVIWHDLISDDYEGSKTFYQTLFGWRFEEVPLPGGRYALIRHEGRVIGGLVDQSDLNAVQDISQWVTVLSVWEVSAAVQAVERKGGTVFAPPTPLGERGTLAVVADSQGAVFALLQTRDGDPRDSAQVVASGDFLWNELWTDNPDAAVDFYRHLAPYGVIDEDLDADGSGEYRLLNTQGVPRAGIRQQPVPGLNPVWVNYLRVADGDQLRALLSRVEGLGGKVLVPATARPMGGEVALIAGPSGAGIALQTWSDEDRARAAARGGRQ